MPELTALSNEKHRDLRVVDNAINLFAAGQHVIRVQATEVGKVVANFPVMFNRNPHTGNWAISASTSIEAEGNLFVRDGEWVAAYRPISLETHPLYLLNAPGTEEGYAVGIFEDGGDFSRESGERLFDDGGRPSAYLSKMTTMLEDGIEEEIRSQTFIKAVNDLNLLRSIDIHVYYEDETVKTITGLMVIDEDKLKDLTAEQLADFNQKGYLVPMHATLVSVFQLNALVRRHNEAGLQPVRQVKISVTRDAGAE